MKGKDELNLLKEVYDQLATDAVEFAENAIQFTKRIAERKRRFKHLCLALILYSCAFMALSFYLFSIPVNFVAVIPLLTQSAINVAYATLIWRSYSETVKRYKELADAEKEFEKIKEKARKVLEMP